MTLLRPKIRIDENIPYMRGRLEDAADVIYADQNDFSPESVKECDALIVRTRTKCDSSLLDDTKVKVVATATIGTDHIDLQYCREKGIKLENAPGCNAPGVAQYVWSCILHLGFNPKRGKIGIIGCGNVGSLIAEWGLLLGCEILVSDPPKSQAAEATGTRWLPSVKAGKGTIREAELEEILKECDVVTLHTPLTFEGEHATFHLIGKEELDKMKPGVILVNAARGPVVDNKDLKEALQNGCIQAVLDTWEKEPTLDPELLDKTAIATPHIAGYSRQGKERATRMTIEAMERFFGFKAHTEGLTGKYRLPDQLTEETIIKSYNPYTDDAALRNEPGSFETLRHDYHYREEI